MLRQFQYIDVNGKDQGVNVRNRAKELADLLSDVDKIRAERKKARANRNKFGGVEGGGGMSGGLSSGSRYGGYGSEDASYGGYSGGTYGDGGGFGGNTSSGFHDSGTASSSTRRDRFEEYDENDESVTSPTASARRKLESASSTPARREKKKSEEVAKEPEDLFSFGDDDIPPAIPPKPSNTNGKQVLTGTTVANEDDDFDDFISATPTTQPTSVLSPPPFTANTQYAAPQPVSAAQGMNISGLVGFTSPSPAQSNPAPTPQHIFSSPPPSTAPYQQPRVQPQPRPTGYQAPQPNYFTSVPVVSSTSNPATAAKSNLTSTSSFNSAAKPPAKSSSSGGDAFGSLWSTASAGAGIKKTPTAGSQGPNLASMAKEKSSLGLWGAASGTGQTAPLTGGQGQGAQGRPKVGGGLDDLLG